jgi:predicted nucleic acid-binding protein
VISVYNDEFTKARAFIEKARQASRAYETIVKVQQLTELEEIIAYKQFRSEEAKRTMREMWRRRLTVIAVCS